jgi:hypothetical protein
MAVIKLTENELSLLKALDRAYREGRGMLNGHRIWVFYFGGLHGDKPLAGIWRTASSLVRKGLVTRGDDDGNVGYAINDAGLARLGWPR